MQGRLKIKPRPGQKTIVAFYEATKKSFLSNQKELKRGLKHFFPSTVFKTLEKRVLVAVVIYSYIPGKT